MNPATLWARRVDASAIARAVVVLASVWFAFAAGWGMFGVPGAGHIDAGSAANTMAGENMLRWNIIYPAWGWYGSAPPTEPDYYCAHPFGKDWVPAILIWIFGHHDFVIHLPAFLMSAAIPPLLYGIAKARWGVSAGAVAAAAYVVVPIAVGFSNFWNLETLCIFGVLLFFWGHSRHMATGRNRHLLASLLGLIAACSGDWVGYLLVAPTLGWAFLRVFVLPADWSPPVQFRSYAGWWAVSVALATGTLLLWLGLFRHVHHLSAWLLQGSARGGGDLQSLTQVLEGRRAWIDFSFTPLAILLGKAAAPVCLGLFLVTRQDEDTYAPALLFGAVFQYVAFRQGADVHIFWPHYFAPYFALALARMAAALSVAIGLVVRGRNPAHAAAVASWLTLAIGLLPPALMAPDAVRSLLVWRRTGGKYDEGLKRSNIDLLVALRQVVVPRTARGTRIDAHPSVDWGWEHQWSYQGDANLVLAPAGSGTSFASLMSHPFFIARASGLTTTEQKAIVASSHVRIYGDTWIVDQREASAPLDAFSMNEREPNPIQWLFTNATEPVRTVGAAPDPWLTWEWRTHLGQSALPPPDSPSTLDELRVAYNAAVERGDSAAAGKWRTRIEGRLDRTVATSFDPGVNLVGVRETGGVQPRLEIWMECTGPLGGDAVFGVQATGEKRAWASLMPVNETVRDMAWPHPIPTGLWRRGYLYKTQVVLNHLIEYESYEGYWAPRGGPAPPHRIDGKTHTMLAVLP
jgi:4-amino-4-deoxy-L-arabinose transferase-like glycosyltransferase